MNFFLFLFLDITEFISPTFTEAAVKLDMLFLEVASISSHESLIPFSLEILIRKIDLMKLMRFNYVRSFFFSLAINRYFLELSSSDDGITL
jgi:hypothetical protein